MEPKSCPNCKKSFQGEPIPEDVRERLGYTSTHYSNVIGLVDLYRDRITQWKCPFCGHVWPRDAAKA